MARHAQEKSAVDVAAKWQTNFGAAGQTWENGINAVTSSPGAKAAAMKDVWLARLTARANKWAAKLRAMSLDDWKTKTIANGRPKFASGGTKGHDKMQNFMESFLPIMYNARRQLPAKQKGNIDNALARIRPILEAAQRYAQGQMGNIK